MDKKIVLYGGGGYSRVVKECAERLKYKVVAVYDDNVHPYNAREFSNSKLILAIGNPAIRQKLALKCEHKFGVLIHPYSVIAPDVEIGEGSVVLAGAVIQAGAKIGKHVIINSNVTVDHGAVIDDFCLLYPGVYVGGDARIGAGSLINPNAVVMRLANLSENTVVKAGEVVI
jgi:sugar O-acyltransferase (sialic acid O-acetyltransferase NeuD family)